MTNKTLKPIAVFNTIAGFPCEQRDIHDRDVIFQRKLIEEEVKELHEAMDSGNISETLKEAADLIVVTAGLIHRLGYDPDEVMELVNESNMSKFCVDLESAQSSVEMLKQTQGDRYENIHYEKIGFYYVIYGTPVGSSGKKILKGENYFKVKPTQFNPLG